MTTAALTEILRHPADHVSLFVWCVRVSYSSRILDDAGARDAGLLEGPAVPRSADRRDQRHAEIRSGAIHCSKMGTSAALPAMPTPRNPSAPGPRCKSPTAAA